MAEKKRPDEQDGGRVTSDIGPWAMVPVWVLGKRLTAAELAVYVALRSFADREGDCYPKARTIADRANVSLGTARNAIQELRRRGLIDTEEIHRDDGSLAGLWFRMRDIDPYPNEEVEPRRTRAARTPASDDADPSTDAESTQNDRPPAPTDVDPPTPTNGGGYTNECTQEHTKEHTSNEHTKKIPPSPFDLDSLADQDQAKEGGISEKDQTPLDNAVAWFATRRKDWRPAVVREVLTAGAALVGNDLRLAFRALRELADPSKEPKYGPTTSPRRLTSNPDGPWWAAARAASPSPQQRQEPPKPPYCGYCVQATRMTPHNPGERPEKCPKCHPDMVQAARAAEEAA